VKKSNSTVSLLNSSETGPLLPLPIGILRGICAQQAVIDRQIRTYKHLILICERELKQLERTYRVTYQTICDRRKHNEKIQNETLEKSS